MPKYKSKFQDEWLTNEKYRTWIRRVKNNPHVAYCYCCSNEISIAGQGTKALDSHITSPKHSRSVPSQSPLAFPSAVIQGNSNSPNASQQNSIELDNDLRQQNIDVHILKQDTLESEIMWSIDVTMSNYSYRSCERKNHLFISMFHDSKIASQFHVGKTKCAYMILHGIAPYVSDLLNDNLKFLFTLFHLTNLTTVF